MGQTHPEAIICQAAPRWKVLIGQVSTHCLAIEEPLGPILPECRAWKQKMPNVRVKLLECLKAIWRKVQRNRWPAGRQILEIHTFRAPQFVRHVTVLADKCTVKVCCHVVATEASRSIRYHTLMNRPESHSWASWVRGFDPSTESTHCLGFERFTVKTASAVFGALLTGIPNLFVAHLTPSAWSMEILVRLVCLQSAWAGIFQKKTNVESVIHIRLTKVLRSARIDMQPIEFSVCHPSKHAKQTRPCTSQWDTPSHTKDPGSKICCSCTRSRPQHPGHLWAPNYPYERLSICSIVLSARPYMATMKWSCNFQLWTVITLIIQLLYKYTMRYIYITQYSITIHDIYMEMSFDPLSPPSIVNVANPFFHKRMNGFQNKLPKKMVAASSHLLQSSGQRGHSRPMGLPLIGDR